jgi:predicted dithiol-disulfide oxidoreductase (DUF899 family)
MPDGQVAWIASPNTSQIYNRKEEIPMPIHQVVSQDDWTRARVGLLEREKQLTRLRDELAAERRSLPWVEVTKQYEFQGPDGTETLADLFGGRSQLVVKHFMFGPDWTDGCVGCSFHADHMDGANMHLTQHDVTLLAVSRAPLEKINVFKQRMGWRFKWVSSFGSDFNYDFHVSFTQQQMATGRGYYNYDIRPINSEELSGLSVFYKDPEGRVFHTYSSYARGNEIHLGAYNYLDLVPNGRNETGPNFALTDWVRHHDRYGDGARVDARGRVVEAGAGDDCCH